MFARAQGLAKASGASGWRRAERSADLLTALATALVLGYRTLLALRQ
jgi:hypothetical protein